MHRHAVGADGYSDVATNLENDRGNAMTYLATITYKLTEKLFFIPMKVYREGRLLITAESDEEATKKMEEEAKKDDRIYTWYITKSL